MNKYISVLLVLTDGRNKGKIAFQKRSSRDSFPFVCQGTWAGKVEAKEKITDTIKRECLEELGEKFYSEFNFSDLELIEETQSALSTKEWFGSHYQGFVSQTLLAKAQLHKKAFSEFTFIGDKDVIYPMNSKKDPQKHLVLFSDQYQVVKNFFNATKRNK